MTIAQIFLWNMALIIHLLNHNAYVMSILNEVMLYEPKIHGFHSTVVNKIEYCFKGYLCMDNKTFKSKSAKA
jgi:hypothetical protein